MLLVLLLPTAGQAAYTVPYSSPLSDGTTCDAEWTSYTSVRKGSTWKNASGTYGGNLDFSTTGTNGAIECMYGDYAIDAWFISPFITLEAGTDYTLRLYIQTKDYGSTENFEIRMASEASATALKAGTQIIDKPSYSHQGSWELLEVPVSVSATGDYSFGLHCYSAADQGHMFATGFSIKPTQGGGEDPVIPINPSTAKSLPWSTEFATTNDFQEWTPVKGSSSTSASTWNYNSFIHCAQFDAESSVEDDWLITPALNLSGSEGFKLNYKYTAYGDYEIRLGTDKDNLESFDRILVEKHGLSDFDKDDEVIFTVPVEGDYYLAFRANATSGSYMGYRLSKFAVSAHALAPALVSDLKARAASDNSYSVAVSWTNPSFDNAGNGLTAIGKVTLYRNDVAIADNFTTTPGASVTFTDEVTDPGIYTYKVVAEGTGGLTAGDPVPVTSDYVGRPTAAIPFNTDVASAPESERIKWGSIDADNDGNTWGYYHDYSTSMFRSTTNDNGTADNWLVSPYLSLNKGNYKMKWKTYAKSNSYEAGYATDYRNPSASFVKIAEINNESQYGYIEKEVIFNIPESGDYVLVWHHTGSSNPETQYYMGISEVSLDESPVLPTVAGALKAVSTTENPADVTVSWINPVLDNAGAMLTSLSHAIVLRDNESVGRVDNIVPGRRSELTDLNVEGGKEYTYSVEIYNANGKSEDDAPQVTVFVGPGKSVPYDSDFNEWIQLNENNDWYNWVCNEETGYYEFEQSWGSADDYLVSPYILLEDGYDYSISVTTEGIADMDPATWNLTIGSARNATSMTKVATYTTQSSTEQTDRTIISARSEQPTSDEASAKPVVASGNVAIGIHVPDVCHLRVKSVTVEQDGMTGSATIYGSSSLMRYSQGTLTLNPDVETLTIVDLNGRTVYSGTGQATIAMPRGIHIVKAEGAGRSETMKIMR